MRARRYNPRAILNWMDQRGFKGLGSPRDIKQEMPNLELCAIPASEYEGRDAFILRDGRIVPVPDGHRAIVRCMSQPRQRQYTDDGHGWMGAVDDAVEAGLVRIDYNPGRAQLEIETNRDLSGEQLSTLRELLRASTFATVDIMGPGRAWLNTRHFREVRADEVLAWIGGPESEGKRGGHRGLAGPIEDKAFKRACDDAFDRNIERAGFILPDGCTVNLDTHEDIEFYYGGKKPWLGKPWWQSGYSQRRGAVEHTVMQGGIRVWVASGSLPGGDMRRTVGLELHKRPNAAQMRELRTVCKDADTVYLDVRDGEGDVTESEEVDVANVGALLRKLPSMGFAGVKSRGLSGPGEDAAFEKACSTAGIPPRDLERAGFLLPNGCVVGFDTHDEIFMHYPAEQRAQWMTYQGEHSSPIYDAYRAVDHTVMNGAIRLWRDDDQNALALDLHRKPTEAQMRVLPDLLKDVDHLYVDIRGEDGRPSPGQHGIVSEVTRANQGALLRKLRLVGYEGLKRPKSLKGRKGLGQRVAYPAGTPEGRMKWHFDPYRFKIALKQAEKCGPVEKACQTQTTPRGDRITTCTWRSRGQVIAAAAGTATGEGTFSWTSRGTALWTDRDLLKGRCPR